jgi:hypothetical protein
MADIDGSADPTDPTPAPSDARNDAPTDAAGAGGAEGPKPRGPKVSRRVALGMIGGGVVAGAGFLTSRRVLEAEETANKRVQPAAPSSTQGSAPATTTTEPVANAPTTGHALWSDPATWGGRVPGAGDLATVTQPVLLDVDAEVAGVLIEPAGELIFDPATSHTLTSSANVVVKGALRMRPEAAAIEHVLAFTGIDESKFVGGDSHTTMDTDVGVWIVESGVFDVYGTPKTAWTHLTAAAAGGASSIEVEAADGWQVGDEIVVTPTGDFDYGDHYMHHDRRTITAVSGKSVTLDEKLDYDHPFVTVREGVTHRPEVLNLSRNVRIEGEPDHRAHVMQLHGGVPQKIGWVGLRHLGPSEVLGRYSLHFHMCGAATAGSTVEGAVAYDSGNHAFVPHLSDGITYTDCVVHDSVKDAFWWDIAGEGQSSSDIPSNQIVWDRCVASYIDFGESAEDAHSNSGFMMGAGRGNVARNCVATGVRGRSEGATGFQWNAGSNDETHGWVFEDNLAHNNTHSALFYWQNNAPKTVVERFTAYNCGQGIYAGSYMNLVSYRDCTVYACADWGLNVRATPPGGGETITYDGMYIDGAGMSDFAVKIEEHTLSDDVVTVFTNGIFKGGKEAQVGFPTGGELRQMYDFVDCTFEGNAFHFAEGVPADSQIRVRGGNLGSLDAHPPGGPGDHKPEWNGSVTPA